MNSNTSLEELIRENSWFLCEICKFKSESKKGLRINTIQSHSVGSIENNCKVLVYFGGGLREDNEIKYINCNICRFQKEDTGHADNSLSGQSFSEMEGHTTRKNTTAL